MKIFLSLLLVLGVLIGCAGLGGLWAINHVRQPGIFPVNTLVQIDKGIGVRGMAKKLVATGAVRDEWEFMAAVALRLHMLDLQAGEYEIPASSSPVQIADLIASGKVYQHMVTIPEGLSVKEIVALINAAPALDGVITDLPPEGSLLPDTYAYTYGTKRSKIIARMQTAMISELNRLWANHAPTLPYKTQQEALTMASIIERETALKAERFRVAGVFVNRLNKGMKLQTDPTIIYAVTGGMTKKDAPITQSDLVNPSPYNTYLHTGLPPTPIANPGKAALEAAFAPEAHNYLFFVADGTGGHKFSETYGEHVQGVKDLRQREQQVATPTAPAAPATPATPATPAVIEPPKAP